MSIIFKINNAIFIDHKHYVSKLYKSVSVNDNIQSFTISAKLFSINNSIKNNRKRKHNSDHILEATTVNQIYESFLKDLPVDIKTGITNQYKVLNESDVRKLSRKLFELTVFDHTGMSGGNNSEKPLKCKIQDDYYLIPQKSRFFCGCVKEQCSKLVGDKFDIVIVDPPWWNKFIRRLKSSNEKLSYSMMYNEDIASIPVQNIVSENCLIAVWCTNAPSNIAAVNNLIFPKWGVEYLTTWYWLKLTTDLKPLCSFGFGSQKQPYERIILGKIGKIKDVPDCQLILSIPSALHSHKPPLLDILTSYVNANNPQTLELFARYLLPNTTSVGFEPLKWQHMSLYETVIS